MGFVLLFSLLSPSYLAEAQEYNGPANTTTVGGISFYEADDTGTTNSSNPPNSQETESYEKQQVVSSKPHFPNTGEKSAISVLVIGLVFVVIAFLGIMRKKSKQ
ncbi:LPXTG-domain-containing protein cell wall anchor domain [Enterococcus quebecensis]|nr:LPXTG-domain-containing protein cell wall anchor domain [Enterococcus quebecensis]